MGSTHSSLNSLKQNENLIKFASSSKVDEKNLNYWLELLSFTYSNVYRSLDESKQFEFSIIPLLETFFKHNPSTHNLSKLLKVFLSLSSQLKGTNVLDPNYKVLYWQTFNSVLILRCCIKYLIQMLAESNVLSHLSDPNGSNEEENLELLMSALIEIIVDIEIDELTYALHTESINLLIVLFSVQMYLPRIATKSIVYQTVFKEKCTIHSIKFMKRLLINFSEQRSAPCYENGSLILGLMSGVWNMINLGYGKEEDNGLDRVLARLSLLLILILTNHSSNKLNPYREALFNCIDVQNNYESGDHMVTGFKIEFPRLFDVLCQQQNEDQATLLLYLLIHKNPQFKIYVLSRTSDLHLLVVPLLRILYTSAERSSHHIYMALIILLILSEDSLFNDAVHDIMLKNVTWYKDKNLMEISLGGLIILVFLRTIQFNISRTIDKFLHTNLLATLANMSSHFKRLSTVVCEKIVVLFKKLTKRMNKVLANLQQTSLSNSYIDQNSTIGSDKETDIQSNCEELIQDISIYEEVLRMILEIINSALANQLTHNPNLIYTLLYNKQIFEPFQSHVTFQDIVMNIETVLIYFANRINGKEGNLSVDDVYGEIENASLQWPADKLKKFPELIFRYVEDDQPDEFFIPYIWTLVYKNSSLFFNSRNIVLFNPNRNIV